MSIEPVGNTVLVVAGEASADSHGAKVIHHLKNFIPDVRIFGLGGNLLQQEGLETLADSSCLNVVGFSEALRQIFRVRKLYTLVCKEVLRRRPRVALLLDLPGFNLRLAGWLRRMHVEVVYYIAPQAWAWRRGRVKKIRKRVDRLCVVFPFEQTFFQNANIAVEYVGHPLTEQKVESKEVGPNSIALVPGSRPAEIERLLPVMAEVAQILTTRCPKMKFVLPVAPGVDEDRIRRCLRERGVVARLVYGGAPAALAEARVALVTSGTATLEAALAKVPMVVIYKLSRTTMALARLFYKLPFFCMVNILLQKPLVPELLQGFLQPARIADLLLKFMEDGGPRDEILVGYERIRRELGSGKPSQRVAEVLAGMLER